MPKTKATRRRARGRGASTAATRSSPRGVAGTQQGSRGARQQTADQEVTADMPLAELLQLVRTEVRAEWQANQRAAIDNGVQVTSGAVGGAEVAVGRGPAAGSGAPTGGGLATGREVASSGARPMLMPPVVSCQPQTRATWAPTQGQYTVCKCNKISSGGPIDKHYCMVTLHGVYRTGYTGRV